MKATRIIAIFVCVVVATCGVPHTRADFTFGEPVNLKSLVPTVEPGGSFLCFSPDGLEMYMDSWQGAGDLCVLRRASTEEDWGLAENLGPMINSPYGEGCVSISADGLTLYFNSNRPGGYGGWDIYMSTRATKNDPWSKAVAMAPPINRTGSSATDGEPWISPDGLELYFISYRSGGYGKSDIWVARRATKDDPWGNPENLGPAVNSPYQEQFFSLSPDGLLLLFCDCYDSSDTPRPGGYGAGDMWMSRRASLADPWQAAVNLGPMVNTSGYEFGPRISPDGSSLHFWTLSDNWQVPILPIVDFNADGNVDLVDLVMLIDNWGTGETLCDIGPMPWGDGKVDIEDLKVFMTYWEKENPPKSNDGN